MPIRRSCHNSDRGGAGKFLRQYTDGFLCYIVREIAVTEGALGACVRRFIRFIRLDKCDVRLRLFAWYRLGSRDVWLGELR